VTDCAVQFSMEQIPVRSVCGWGCTCAHAQEFEQSLTNENPLSSNIICLQVRQQHRKGPVTCNEPAGWFCLVSTHANIAWILSHVDTIQEVQHVIIHRPYTCLTGACSTPCSYANNHPCKIPATQTSVTRAEMCIHNFVTSFWKWQLIIQAYHTENVMLFVSCIFLHSIY